MATPNLPDISPSDILNKGRVGVPFQAFWGTGDTMSGWPEISGLWASNPITEYSLSGDVPPGLYLETVWHSGGGPGDIIEMWLIKGTPTTQGSFTFTLSVSGPDGTDSRSYTLQIQYGAALVAPSQTIDCQIGVPLANKFLALDDAVNRPLASGTFYKDVNSGPSWLSVEPLTGRLVGVPLGALTPPKFRIFYSTALGYSAPVEVALNILQGSWYTLPEAVVRGEAAQITFNGETQAGFTFSATGLPQGLSIHGATGMISGTPSVFGSFAPVVTYRNGREEYSHALSLSISGGVPIVDAGQVLYATAQASFSSTPQVSTDTAVTGWTATGLPAWAQMDAATGEITGVPPETGNFSFSVAASSTAGSGPSVPIQMSVLAGVPIINAAQNFTGTVGQFFSQTPSLTDAANRPATSWTATGLPPGLTINANTGAITGTPGAEGSFTASVVATGYVGAGAPTNLSFQIAISLPAGTLKKGAYYSRVKTTGAFDLDANKPSGAYEADGWQIINEDETGGGSLPPGMGILPGDSHRANIVGTPTTVGQYNGKARFGWYGQPYAGGTSGNNYVWSDYISFSLLVVSGPTIQAAQVFSGAVGTAFAHTIALAADSMPATSWSVTGLPAWCALNASTGVISGTPTARGNTTITLTATGGTGTSFAVTAVISISGGAPILTSGQVFSGKVGEVFIPATPSLTDASNRPASSWAISAGSLPAGLSLNATTGVITGTPTQRGSFATSIRAMGQVAMGDPEQITFEISGGVPNIVDVEATPWTGAVGAAFSRTPQLTDSANRPVTLWSVTGLPDWGSINSATGSITGTPQNRASFILTFTATGPGGTDMETREVEIGFGVPVITPGQSFSGKVGNAFSSSLTLEDALDRPVSSWSAESGLPAGLSLNTATGAITGTPTAKGSFTASFTVTGAGGTSAAANVSFVIAEGAPLITAGQTLGGAVGTAFSRTPALTDASNRPATSWNASGLPDWATLNATTGAITGTPQDSGSATITLTATGPGGDDTETAQIVIAIGAPIINAATFSGKVGEAFSQSLTLDDAIDRPATSWTATGLPAGLSINASGVIAGTPTAAGTFTAAVTATGPGGTSQAQSVPLSIAQGAPIIADQFIAATLNQALAYAVLLTDSTNRPATSWTATGLPAWAVLNSSTGTIAGTPTTLAPAAFQIYATGPGGQSLTKSLIITVSSSGGGGGGGGNTTMLEIAQSQFFTATLATPFTATPEVLRGTPVQWYASALPEWASLNPITGAISGTPKFTGTATITLTALDASNNSASATVSITTVSWNTLEIFVDPKTRKILSRANTRSVMQKMFLKRDDLVNFQVVFVNDDQPFGLPSDFAVTVGIKASYASDDFIAFSDSVNGTLSLASDTVQDLFADEPDSVEAIFEVKWEDETSASRTASLPVIIQNTILRGNIAEPGTTTGGGGFTASGLSKYLAARQKILTGETAETTTLTLSEPLAGEAVFHRPLANNLPDHRGWITGVSAVSLEKDTGTEALVAGEDFVFYPDRQCFYFLNPETTGDIEILGTASRNFINFGVTIEKSVNTVRSTSTLIDTASPLFEITSVSITTLDNSTELPDGFYFDRDTATLFLETKFTCSSAVVVFKDALGVEFQETFAGIADGSTLSVPKSLSAASVVKVTLFDTEHEGEPFDEFTPFAVLEKTNSGNDILHIGWTYAVGYGAVQLATYTVSATHGTDSFVFTFRYWPGNAFELPRLLDNVHTLKIGGSDALVVFDSTEQKLDFCQAKTGTLHYTATHKAYEGIANGGETLQVIAEIPGVFATTAGTGHHISTLRTLNPSQDWYNWWYAQDGIYFVQIVDDKNVVIYQDNSHGAFENSRPGYTAEDLKPLTLKLPFAALWSLSRRDDTSLFQEAFTPNFATATFSSATYPELDDTQRYAAESMGAGKTITLSTNKTAPVRGVQGVNFTGPKPTYYAGGTVPYFVLATYKWFVVKCVNTNANPLLTANKNYLLCVNNTNFDNRAIMVNITNEGYNVAADLYEIKGGN